MDVVFGTHTTNELFSGTSCQAARHPTDEGRSPSDSTDVATAIFGFVGVLLGSLTALASAIYKERVTDRREAALRDHLYERERQTARNVFQRQHSRTAAGRHRHDRVRARRA
jgi:hypothetical protein